jgi:hypothetical protein
MRFIFDYDYNNPAIRKQLLAFMGIMGEIFMKKGVNFRFK